MPATEIVRARIEPELKSRVVEKLERHGMTPSIAITLLFHRLDRDPDFHHTLKVPNAETVRAMLEERGTITTIDEMMRVAYEDD